MRRYAVIFALTTLLNAPVHAGNLYQWVGKDGTPTYSPDPPPDGVSYEVVGADLKPLPKKVDVTAPVTTAPSATAGKQKPVRAKTSAIVTAPEPVREPTQTADIKQSAPEKQVARWKPVRYANDPKPLAKSKKKQVDQIPTAAEIALQARNSPGCVKAKQQKAVLESRFAKATSDAEMDKAILQLQQHQSIYRSECAIDVAQ